MPSDNDVPRRATTERYGDDMSDTALPPPVEQPEHSATETASSASGADSGARDARNVGTEFVATALVMLAGPGTIVLTGGQADPLAVAFAFGAAMAIAIGVIGAVANPALSLALMIAREISPRQTFEDWIGQFAGGIVGAALIWGINDTTRSAVGSNGWSRVGFSELGSVIAGELVFTIVLVVVFLSAISQGLPKAAIAGFTGLAYAIGHLVLLRISGGGMNPARSLGSAVFTSGDPNPLGQVVVFVVVPMVAAVAAVFVWLAIDDADVDDTMFDGTVIDALGDRIDGTVD
jgi:aquaporin Z